MAKQLPTMRHFGGDYIITFPHDEVFVSLVVNYAQMVALKIACEEAFKRATPDPVDMALRAGIDYQYPIQREGE